MFAAPEQQESRLGFLTLALLYISRRIQEEGRIGYEQCDKRFTQSAKRIL
jgi:hypothetical protein